MKSTSENSESVSAKLNLGDTMWVWPAVGASRLEKVLRQKLRSLFPTSATVYITLCSISPAIVKKEVLSQTISFLESPTLAFVVETSGKEKAKKMNFNLIYDKDFQGNKTVAVGTVEIPTSNQFLLAVTSPEDPSKHDGIERQKASGEIGLLSCLLGEAIVLPPLYNGHYSIEKGKFIFGNARIVQAQKFDKLTKNLDVLASSYLGAGKLGEKDYKALSMIYLAKLSKDPVARWVYYRAALEQAFGKNYLNDVRKFYKKDPEAKVHAEDVLLRLKKLRDDVVHSAVIGEYDQFDERSVQAIVLDGVIDETNATNSNLLAMMKAAKKYAVGRRDREA